ncbi:MAG: hypothetical protein LH645_11485 [Actinomycetia bacterium]|nr:hypothetical protein [Actinomycetes bacterium]
MRIRGISAIVTLSLGSLGTLAAVAAERALRGEYETWGATPDEVRATLPGDGIVPEPLRASTRVIDIDAAPDAVWPWIVQIGHRRAGLYSYDWLENLVGCDLHSADQVLPEHQTLQHGDVIRMGPEGYPEFSVVEVEPPHHLILVSAGPHTRQSAQGAGTPVSTTWQSVIEPHGAGSRLISAQRPTYPSSQSAMWALVQPIDFVMERKMLLGIQLRAERSTQSRTNSQPLRESKPSANETMSVAPKPQSMSSSPPSEALIESS